MTPNRATAANAWSTCAALGCLVLFSASLSFARQSLASFDEPTWGLLRNTLCLALGTWGISLPLGTLLALLIVRTDIIGRRAVGAMIATLLFVPLYIQAAAWDAGFGRLGWLTVESGQLVQPVLTGWRAAIWIHAMAATAWVTLIVAVGLWFVEPELEETALLDGTAAQVFFRVTLVRTIVSVAVAAVWILVSTAGEITVTDLYGIRTYAEKAYAPNDNNVRSLVESTLVGSTIVASLVYVALIATGRLAPPEQFSSQRAPVQVPLGWWRPAASAGGIGLVLLMVGVPLGNLCYKAGLSVERAMDTPVVRWTFVKLVQMIISTPLRYGDEFRWTLLIGTIASMCAMLLAFPLAWMARHGGARAWPALIVTAISLSLPGPLIGIAIIWLLNWEQSPVMIWLYDRTILAPVLATTIRGLPLAVLLLWASLRTIPRDTLDIAATEGAGPLAQFWYIALGQRVPAIAAAWVITFAVTSGDLAASILVFPPSVETVPRRVFGLVHSGVQDHVAAICLVTAAGYALIPGLVLLLFRWSQRVSRSTNS